MGKMGGNIYICKERAIKIVNKYTQTTQISKQTSTPKHFETNSQEEGLEILGEAGGP